MAEDLLPVLVSTGLQAESAGDAIRVLASILADESYVDPEYSEAALGREEDFPTGLPTEPPVALPHADPDYVRRSAAAVGVFKDSIVFKQMGTPSESLDVRLVFLLAIAKKEEMTDLLRQLMVAFRDTEGLSALTDASNDEEAREAVAKILGQGLSQPTFVFDVRTPQPEKGR